MRRLFQSNKSYLHEVSRFCIFFPVTINNYHYDYNLQYSITTGYFQLIFFFFFFFFIFCQALSKHFCLQPFSPKIQFPSFLVISVALRDDPMVDTEGKTFGI